MSDTIRGFRESILRALGDLTSGSGNAPAGGASISDWRLVRTRASGNERYYVGDRLEQARATDTDECRLTVYVDSEDAAGARLRGEATVTIRPTDAPEEIAAIVARAAHAASKSKNPWFELPGKAAAPVAPASSAFAEGDVGSHIAACREALYAPARKDARGTAGAAGAAVAPASRINSLELFLKRERTGFINSRGQVIDEDSWKGFTEFVVESVGGGVDVELFDELSFSEPDPARLEAVTASRLAQVRDRAIAKPLPDLNGLPVLLVGKEAEALFGWFFDNSLVQAIYTKASSFGAGIDVQSPEGKGAPSEPLDIRAEAFLAGMPQSAAFDADGFPLEPVDVIRGGILKTLTGSVRYADWLGVPRKGAFPLFSVSPGRASLAQLREKPCLEPVMFSDFQMDPVTGAFGGEIRLAYWNDGNARIPVTGGSITGTVARSRLTMLRSEERDLGERSLCPKGLLLENVTVTSAGR